MKGGAEFLGYIVQKVTYRERYGSCPNVPEPGYSCVFEEVQEDSFFELFPIYDFGSQPPDQFNTGVIDIETSPCGTFWIIGEARFIHHSDIDEGNDPDDADWKRETAPGDRGGEFVVEVNGKEVLTGMDPNSEDIPEGLDWDGNFGGAGQDMGTHFMRYRWNYCGEPGSARATASPAHSE